MQIFIPQNYSHHGKLVLTENLITIIIYNIQIYYYNTIIKY